MATPSCRSGRLRWQFSISMPSLLDMATAQHLWMTGAVGLMTLAVMTRATLGHTGRELRADGWDAKEALDALASLVEAGFNERD